ncbi:MAG TPA: NADH-quinone oxidoreductase subunit C [Kiritimatiellia bacterium]|nr:MAG: Formate hydrogenlyase subunit 5 precursor [Verrucomicrobia bacterium ADurb.Bin070]HQQ92620.1 NADH-quinone oxidoreductase subunit C [Kiritimatiellia bacterium]
MNAPLTDFARLTNGQAVEIDRVPVLDLSRFHASIAAGVHAGCRVSALFGAVSSHQGKTRLYAVLSDDEHNLLLAAAADVASDAYPSLTPQCAQVHLFEREIAEQFGVRPEGHPWLKPVRYRRSWTGRDAWQRPAGEAILPAVGDFYRVEGEQVHEVAVGPVHAGVIEPGHFRFQCHGEQVFHLEIALGFQHRGIEEMLLGGPDARTIHLVETLSGDATVAHATAYSQISEALAGRAASARGQALRGVALELERMATHIGDLGALAGDVGYLPTASFCGRIRGDVLNMTALLCGSRFGRGLVRPGGVGFDVDAKRLAELGRRLDTCEKDARVAIELLWKTPSVMARFEEVGTVPREVAVELGLVGPAARAAGLERDIRRDQPCGIFCFSKIPVATCEAGDVFARAYVRWLEIQYAIAFIRDQLHALPGGAARMPVGTYAPERFAVALTEGLRGEVCHVAITDAHGRFARYKVVDPSFHNWTGLAYALRDQEISDFPICNKSFNLSYCGHDL